MFTAKFMAALREVIEQRGYAVVSTFRSQRRAGATAWLEVS